MDEQKPPAETWSERFERETAALWKLVRRRPLLGLVLVVALLFYAWHTFLRHPASVDFATPGAPSAAPLGANPRPEPSAPIASGVGTSGPKAETAASTPPVLSGGSQPAPAEEPDSFIYATMPPRSGRSSAELLREYVGTLANPREENRQRVQAYLKDVGRWMLADKLIESDDPALVRERDRAVVVLGLTEPTPSSAVVLRAWLKTADGEIIPANRVRLENFIEHKSRAKSTSEFLLSPRFKADRDLALEVLGISPRAN